MQGGSGSAYAIHTARVDGCWANVLDDCESDLEDEHIVSVIVWRPMNGIDTRKARERQKVEVRGVRGAAEFFGHPGCAPLVSDDAVEAANVDTRRKTVRTLDAEEPHHRRLQP